MATVTTQQQLLDAIAAADPQISIANDISLDTEVTVNYILVLSSDGSTLSWAGTANKTMFSVTGAGELTIGNVVLDGMGGYATLVSVAATATFIMNSGAALKNVQTNSANNALKIGTQSSQGGTFLMNGGQITGVMLDAVVSSYGGDITMRGDAAITRNTAYGIALQNGSLTMIETAGITYNIAARPGAGILAIGSAVINMGLSEGDAPRISNNESTNSYCGGVYMSSGTTMNMDFDAAISDNSAVSLCGGIAVADATLHMKGNASISGNATQNGGGGGIFGTAAGIINMEENAAVFGNSVTADGGLGGGVHLQQDDTVLTMTGNASVYDNAATNGAGISVTSGTRLVMGQQVGDAPFVQGNDAAGNGGGIYIAAGGTAQLAAGTRIAGEVTSADAYAATNNTAGAGAGIYNAGVLNISDSVQIDGLYFSGTDTAPVIADALTEDAFTQLEASGYVALENIPVVVATKGDAYAALSETDRSTFIAPQILSLRHANLSQRNG